MVSLVNSVVQIPDNFLKRQKEKLFLECQKTKAHIIIKLTNSEVPLD